MPAKNKFISESGVDIPDRMPNEKMAAEEMDIQKDMGFWPLEENMHGKSSMSPIPTVTSPKGN